MLSVGLMFTPMLQSIEKLDADKPFYTQQIQDLILGKETELQYDKYRFFGPALSISIAALFHTSYYYGMIIVSLLAGIATIWFLYNNFYQITIKRKKDIELHRTILCSLYGTSAAVLQFAGTYFVDSLALFFAFVMIYCLAKRDYGLLLLAFVGAISIKETALCYIIILVAYMILEMEADIYDMIKLAAVFLGGCAFYVLQYVVGYNAHKHLILNNVVPSGVMLHFQNMLNEFGMFFSHRVLLLLLSILFAYGLFFLLLCYAYDKYKPWWKLFICHSLMWGLVIGWSLETTAPKFVLYLTAPISYVLIAKYASDKFSWGLVLMNLLLTVVLLVVYIISHNTSLFYSLLEIGS